MSEDYTMTPKIKPHQAITVHADYTVSYFSIYLQQWQRTSAAALVNKHDDFAALTDSDRVKINAALKRAIQSRSYLRTAQS